MNGKLSWLNQFANKFADGCRQSSERDGHLLVILLSILETFKFYIMKITFPTMSPLQHHQLIRNHPPTSL